MVGEANTESALGRFEAWVNLVERLRDYCNWAREELTIEIVGEGVEGDILFCHSRVGDGNTDLAMAVAFVSEELGD